jgi:hypothetical protein
MVILAGALTAGVTWRRAVGPASEGPRWNVSQRSYQLVGKRLLELDPSPDLVAVNNPPGFYGVTGLESVVIPNGPPSALQQVVARYGVDWVVLEANHPEGLEPLYVNPGAVAWLEPVSALNGSGDQPVLLLRVLPSEVSQ